MAFNTETFIALKDDIIVAKYHTSNGLRAIENVLKRKRIDYDEIIDSGNDFEGKKGQNIKLEFDKNLKLLPLAQRVANRVISIPDRHKIKDNTFVIKSLQEQVDDGDEVLDPRFKVVDNRFVEKTEEELLAEGLITQKEIDDRIYEEEIAKEERAILREQAIERIKARKKQKWEYLILK